MPIQLPPYIEDQLRQIAYEREKMLRQVMQAVGRQERELLARAGIAPYAKTISPEEWAKIKLDAEEAREIRCRTNAENGRQGGIRKGLTNHERDAHIVRLYQELKHEKQDPSWATHIQVRLKAAGIQLSDSTIWRVIRKYKNSCI